MKLFKFALALLIPVFGSIAMAQNDTFDFELMARTSCSARAIDRYYCPAFGTGLAGPYFDNGCSVKCSSEQKAVCKEATCEEGQTGRAIESSCTCQ